MKTNCTESGYNASSQVREKTLEQRQRACLRPVSLSFPLGKGNRSGCERGRWWPSFFFLRHFAQKQHKTFKSDSKCKITLFEEFENNDSNVFSRRAALSALPLCARSSLAPVSNKKGQMFVDLFESSHFGFSKTSEIWIKIQNCIFGDVRKQRF